MIVHYAEGGLGNQLFNYAAARSLADRRRTGLLVDASSYAGQRHEGAARPFLLPRFPVRAAFRHAGSGQRSLLQRVADRVRIGASPARVERAPYDVGWFPGFDELPARAILRGHFVALRFFEWNAAAIRADLRPPDGALADHAQGAELARRIRTSNAVSVHVRRGDLTQPGNAWLLLDRVEAYYRAAMDAVARTVADPVFFVFTDDPAWCEDALDASGHTVVMASDGRTGGHVALAEFCLMALCRHHIIANSAFSWWPAWLQEEPGRVLAPARFDSEGRVDVDSLYPSAWERIEW